jgi:ABC-type phosphate/phosphonate transport system substrate-binding protein
MYDRPELQAANDHLWHLVREALGFGPRHLTRDLDLFDLWQSPDLILAQTCSLPFRLFLKDKVQVLGSADYGLSDCPAGYYNSVLVARADDPRPLEQLFQARVIRNQSHSQSGFAALVEAAEQTRTPLHISAESGGHVHSARMVAQGAADLAALDALSWRFIQRYDGFAPSLRVVSHTSPTPSLPFITSLKQDSARIYAALDSAISALNPNEKNTLSLYGLIPHKAAVYLALPIPDEISAN